MPRRIAWFSCGAASAVTAKLALECYENVEVVYCDTMKTEHPDNARFFAEIEGWCGVPIRRIKSTEYADIDDVFMRTRYMAGPKGARCTTEMKKVPRFQFQRADDIHCFGLTTDEPKRIAQFESNNPEIELQWILRENGLTKDDTPEEDIECGPICLQGAS